MSTLNQLGNPPANVNIIPSLEEIEQFKVPLEEGERCFLQQLLSLFASETYCKRNFEVYVQPNLFLGKPDFVILEKNISAWVIEVKDYNPNSYVISSPEADVWSLAKDPTQRIQSPFEQVKKYKSSLMSFANPELNKLEKEFFYAQDSKQKFNLIFRTAVYFSNYRPEDTQVFMESKKYNQQFEQYEFHYILTPNDFDIPTSVVSKMFQEVSKTEFRLNKNQYKDLQAILKVGDSGVNQALPDFQNKKYSNLAQSSLKRQKIRGAAGTGKSTILAKRVASAAQRLERGQSILVTYFNITMGNYLRDKITAEGGTNLNKLGVDVINFHRLYKWRKSKRHEPDKEFEIKAKANDKRYDAIFIDEGQDFESEWFTQLEKDYLKDSNFGSEVNHEFVIFADEDQNIYDRIYLEDDVDSDNDGLISKIQMPQTRILGRWNTLDVSYRTPNPAITKLVEKFHEKYINIQNQTSIQHYANQKKRKNNPVIYKHTCDTNQIIEAIRSCINYLMREKSVSTNDIVILCDDIEFIRPIEDRLKNSNQDSNIFANTATTFVPQSDIEAGMEKDYDQPYKWRFFRNIGPIKLSTVKSFKGWEANCVILILPKVKNRSSRNSYDALNYVGLTRAKFFLYVIDPHSDYQNFFDLLESSDEGIVTIDKRER